MQTLAFDNGDKLPALGLGTWKSKPGEVGAAVKEAVRLGYRHIDCAAIYMNEREVGEALAECFAEKLVRRDELWITSKLWNDKHAPEDVRPALTRTLNDLQLEYLDLYLMHWPVALKRGARAPLGPESFLSLEELPIALTWQALEACADARLTKHLGVSNFSIRKLEDLLRRARRKPEMNQIEMHPYLAQTPMLEFCKRRRVHLTAYSPLGSVDRPDAMKVEGEPVLLEDPRVRAVAERLSSSEAQVLLCWALQRGTAAIPKSVSPERLAQNLAAAELELSEQDMREIDSLDQHRRYITGGFWAVEGGPYTLANLWDE